MRPYRPICFLLRASLLCLAAGALDGQVLVSLGTSTGCGALQGGQTCTLTARVTGTANQAVTWSFGPTVAGATTGTGTAPDSTGLSTNTYKAPSFITARQIVTATATSAADPTQFASAQISLVPVTVTIAVSPLTVTLSAGQTQQFTATVSGISQTGVVWSTATAVGSIDPNTGIYTAPSPVTASQKVTIVATSVFDPGSSGTATVTLQPPPAITVAVAPTTASLTNGQLQQFTATLTNSTMGVTWSLNSQLGSIDNTGLYQAPATLSGTQKVSVIATSVEDPTKTGTASVTLTASATSAVTVSPATVSLSNNQSQQFTATLQGLAPGVTWSISPAVGAIDNTGFYTAPALITGTQKVTVTATSTADASKSGTASITLATVVDVGVGAPQSLVQQFVTAYYRNGFSLLVSLPPLGNVKKSGTTGYVQEFSDAQKTSGVKLALATISPTVGSSSDGTVVQVVQLLSPLYVYYSSVGATTAGYPLMDSQNCPYFDPANSCVFDIFDKGYALFAYLNSLATGQNFTVRQAFYTEWAALGGMNGPGRPIDVETAMTASTATTATVQTFATGAVYSISSGINKGKTFGVAEPLYDLYVSQSGPAGTLGLPTSEVIQVSTGVFRQAFEGGSLQYTSNGGPTVQLPVASVVLTGGPTGTAATLNLGQTLTVTAVPVDKTGAVLSDRPVSWSTTNGKVITIQPNGQSAVLKAVGGGTASVTASSGGVTSTKLTFTVIAPCCQIGDGAPASVQQAFQDAIVRNKLAVQVPAPTAATRVGNGYVQMVQSSDPAAPGVYLLAQTDQLGTAYVVAGAVLVKYQSLGGPAGGLGYPIGDMTAGGTQLFANGSALAGSPVRLVNGAVLAKWASLRYENGIAGPPAADAAAFSTFGANSGNQQPFASGAIYAANEGPRAGPGYFVTGLILARYTVLGGAGGDYGMPVADEFVRGGIHQQNFEGGSITYAPGDAVATEQPAPKVPGVVVAPTSIAAGGRARLAVMGFPNGSTVRVSITGEPDFVFTSSNGAYSWDMAVPLASKSGTVSIHAADTKGAASADGSLAIKGLTDNRLPLAKVQGDNQTGPPGAVLPVSLRIALKDSAGSPVVGAAVVFQASPGAQLSITNAVTDSSGQAETFVRLPNAEGVTAVTADVPSIAQSPITFFARSAAQSLANFPQLIQAGTAVLGRGSATIAAKGALLTAVASILRYHQVRGELPSPNGTSDPATLNQFLLNYCVVDANGKQLCDGYLSNPDSGEQVVNLWRAAEFTGGVDVTVLSPTAAAIADLVAQGTPVLLSLGLSLNGATIGGHYVIATGISADGSIVIQDPSPLFARTALNDYLRGFSVNGGFWQGTLVGAVEFTRSSPSATRFMMGALSQPADLMKNLTIGVQSAAGVCGRAVDLLDAVDSGGGGSGGLTSRITVCDGLAAAYQVSVGVGQPFHAFATDLAAGGAMVDLSGSAVATYEATRPVLALSLAPQGISFRADGVVNAATFTTGIAPGGIMAIFGSGLSGAGVVTAVDIDGTAASILAASPFQINAVVPATLSPGSHTMTIRSAYGTAQQEIVVAAVAPAIFMVGNPPAGAVVNQGGGLNGPASPLPRGQVLIVYATGLGAVVRQGQLEATSALVTVVLNGVELPVAFAGLAPGTSGEYQVNVLIPAATPPGLSLPLTLKEGGQVSNTVFIALQ